MVFDETTKSAPYSLLKDFSQRCPLFYLKKGTAWQDLPLNSFLGEFKSPQTRRSSQNIFSKFTLFLKIKKPQQLGTVGVQPTISELLRFSGGGEGSRTPVRKHFNGTFSGRRRLLRESYSPRSLPVWQAVTPGSPVRVMMHGRGNSYPPHGRHINDAFPGLWPLRFRRPPLIRQQ